MAALQTSGTDTRTQHSLVSHLQVQGATMWHPDTSTLIARSSQDASVHWTRFKSCHFSACKHDAAGHCDTVSDHSCAQALLGLRLELNAKAAQNSVEAHSMSHM